MAKGTKKKPMVTTAQAPRVFSELMATARQRRLTRGEKIRLGQARQILRRSRRPAMNSSRRQARKILHRSKGRRRIKTNKTPRRMRMGTLIELRYKRDFGQHPGFYKHTFRSKPTVYYDASDNSILIK